MQLSTLTTNESITIVHLSLHLIYYNLLSCGYFEIMYKDVPGFDVQVLCLDIL